MTTVKQFNQNNIMKKMTVLAVASLLAWSAWGRPARPTPVSLSPGAGNADGVGRGVDGEFQCERLERSVLQHLGQPGPLYWVSIGIHLNITQTCSSEPRHNFSRRGLIAFSTFRPGSYKYL